MTLDGRNIFPNGRLELTILRSNPHSVVNRTAGSPLAGAGF